ncbi:MAG: hypothetical protein FD126_2935 [Elusimicrobia bacterium]|nr:MAG: hypothetical protein FD126_2935 [Elusimicrobiota bacterium]
MRRGAALALLVLVACRTAAPDPKLRELDSILQAKDDNDPRLDRDFNDLSEPTKSLLRRRYGELPLEYLNERGTIVYLLGRNMRTTADWDFLRDVVSEPPCGSQSDCSKADERGSHGNEVTLAYPALVALKVAQREMGASGRHAARARRVVEAALRSESPAVRRLAERDPGR